VRLLQGKATRDVGRNAESVPIAMAGNRGCRGIPSGYWSLKSALVTFPTLALFVGQFQSHIMCNPRVGGFECAIYSRFVERGREGGCHATRAGEYEIRACVASSIRS
jgi:hypothetical protein